MRSRKTLTVFILAIGLPFALSARAQQKPFTQEQVTNMVRAGLGDETGAKAIEQRGIDFAPADDFLQSLKAAGANETFLQALRWAKQPEQASPKRPLNQVQVFALLVGEVPSHRVTMLVQERGVDFEPTDDYLQEVRLAGGDGELIAALKGAKVTKPATVDPAAQARQAQVKQHVAHGSELSEKRKYAEAEQEYRAALLLDPENADLYLSLSYVLGMQEKWDDAGAAAREAIHLDPNNDNAHVNLAWALGKKGDVNGEITEYREALRLNPNNYDAHRNLGHALTDKGDRGGAIAEEREAVRLNPKDDMAHLGLGLAFGEEDKQGVESEVREALRLNPKNAEAHLVLGAVLEDKGDHDGALNEYHYAYLLDPNDPTIKQTYERGTMSVPETEKHPTNSSEKELPPTEVAKLKGTCTISTQPGTAQVILSRVVQAPIGQASDDLSCKIYNWSNWTVENIKVLLTIKERDKQKGETVVVSREYTVWGALLDSGFYHLQPGTAGTFTTHLGFSLGKHQHFEWKPVSAQGDPP